MALEILDVHFVLCVTVANFQQCAGCLVVFVVSLNIFSQLSYLCAFSRADASLQSHASKGAFCVPKLYPKFARIHFDGVMNCIKAKVILLLL